MNNRTPSPLAAKAIGVVAFYVVIKVLFGPPGSVLSPHMTGSLVMLLPFVGIAAVVFRLGRSRGRGGSW